MWTISETKISSSPLGDPIFAILTVKQSNTVIIINPIGVDDPIQRVY